MTETKLMDEEALSALGLSAINVPGNSVNPLGRGGQKE
jgi:hypothetical protein